MTLRFGDILFICFLSTITGVAGAMLHARFISPPAPAHLIATFNPGSFVMQRMLDKSTNEQIYEAKDAIADSARVIETLAAQGYIVIDSSAVLAAPRNYHVNPDEPVAAADGE